MLLKPEGRPSGRLDVYDLPRPILCSRKHFYRDLLVNDIQRLTSLQKIFFLSFRAYLDSQDVSIPALQAGVRHCIFSISPHLPLMFITNKPKVHHFATQAKEIFLNFMYKHNVFDPSSICPSGLIRSSARRVLHPGHSHEGQCILPRLQDFECGNKRRQKGNRNHKTRISYPTDCSRPSFSDSQPPEHHLPCRHHPDFHSFRPHHRSRSLRRHYSLGRYGCRVLSLPLAHTGSIPRLC